MYVRVILNFVRERCLLYANSQFDILILVNSYIFSYLLIYAKNVLFSWSN